MKQSLHWVSELTEYHDRPTINFVKSLEYSENSMKFNNLLLKLEDNNIEFEIIKGFKWESKNELEKSFRIITIKLKDMENYSRLEEFTKDEFTTKKDKECVKIELIGGI